MDAISLSTGNKLAGRYRVLQKLGEGSFAETFVAEDEHLPDAFRCVIKKLKTGVEEESKLAIAKRLFEAEARMLHQLGCHKQIPQLLAHFEEDGEFYLVEEYVEGSSLFQELATGQKWSEGYVVKLLQDILEPLKFVHQKQVIHRDIKPSNLIRREKDGSIVLIDFGAVKQVTNQVLDDNSIAPHTVIVGTPGYMPGEQLRGSPRPSSDVYAVGMIAIYALTGLNPALGQLPEDESTAEILWHEHATISPELAAILDKMVAYDFRQRYPSAAEALDAINALTLHRQAEAPTILKDVSDSMGVSPAGGPSTKVGASGPRNSGIIINPNAGSGSGIGSNGNLDHAQAAAATSISPGNGSMGTYVVSDANPARVVRSDSPATPKKKNALNFKVFSLGGAAVVALGAIATLASPNIEPICKALNNCSAEVKYHSVYETARDSAESALMAVKGAKSIKDLQSAYTQLQQSTQQLTKIPDAVRSYSEAQKVLPTYQKELKKLTEKIALETKAQQDLKQGTNLVDNILSQKKPPAETVSALTQQKETLQKAVQSLDKIPDNSLTAPQKQVKKQAALKQLKTLDTQIAKRSAIEEEERRRIEAERAAAYARSRPAPEPSVSAPSTGGGTNEPLWGNDAASSGQSSTVWNSGSSGSSSSGSSQSYSANPAPPPASQPDNAPLWGGGGGGSSQQAAPPSSGGSSGGSAQEPLW